MMAYSDDHIALAAEYALGTLDADERAQVETMMSVDKDFTAIVQAWEHRLGVLNQMVGSVEPRPELWDKIRTAIGHSEPQAPIVLPEPPAPPVAASVEEPAAVVDNSNVIRLTANARRWRTVATFTSAIAAALVAMIGVGLLLPDVASGQHAAPAADPSCRSKGSAGSGAIGPICCGAAEGRRLARVHSYG